MFEMNEEQQRLFEALTSLQKEISLNSISGMNDIDCYKNSSGKAKTEKSMGVSVAQILGNLSVKAFISSMSNHIVNPAIMSRTEMLERLTGLARTNMSDLIEWRTVTHEADDDDEESESDEQSIWAIKESVHLDPIKAASIAEVTAGKDGFKIKQHSPLTAMKQLAELAGYEAPKQIEVLAKEELTPWGNISVGVALAGDNEDD